jgi:GNAT superfamily N-acetyltransferase
MYPAAAARRATRADLDALWPLLESFYAIDGHAFDPVRVRTALVPLLADDTYGQVWVVEQDGVLGGYAIVTWTYSLESGGLDCILDELYVQDRSRGVGAGLVQAALAGAHDHGALAVFLETEAPNERARSFYRRHGFTVEDSVWMRRDLP